MKFLTKLIDFSCYLAADTELPTAGVGLLRMSTMVSSAHAYQPVTAVLATRQIEIATLYLHR